MGEDVKFTEPRSAALLRMRRPNPYTHAHIIYRLYDTLIFTTKDVHTEDGRQISPAAH